MPLPLATHDTDGTPPGLDLELTGERKIIQFTGVFFARPQLGNIKLQRLVQIIFASKEVYVAYDLQLGNLYVVDREKNLSLGCRMNAELLPLPQFTNTEQQKQA